MLPLVEPLTPCPACGAAEAHPIHVARNRYAVIDTPYYVILGCRACGLVYVGPRPHPDRAAAFYASDEDREDVWGRGAETADEVERWRQGKLKRARRAIQGIADRVPLTPGAALDFGCGIGVLLDALRERGWETTGFEPNPIARYTAQRHTMITALPDAPSFDLVIAHHVLEHLAEPAAALRQLHAAARPEGLLYVSVPSVDLLPEHGDVHYACNPIHANGFTSAALSNLLRGTAWEPIHLQTRSAKKVHAIARRSAAPLPLVPEALAPALAAFREYGRRLDATGHFQHEPAELSGNGA